MQDFEKLKQLENLVENLLDTIKFQMSGTLDSDRTCIGFRTSEALKSLREYMDKKIED